jgi:dTDP-glucose 4,6-dehydratase
LDVGKGDTAIRDAVGWEPEISLKQGIREMVEWGRKYLDELRNVSTGYVLRA